MARLPSPPANLSFKVQRRSPELISPANPTPYEFKPLSDIDDQEGVRFQIPIIQFYKHDSTSVFPAMQERDPVKVIREALAKTLVYYYHLAGRLREGPNRKLVVECTGEGVLFIEADADVRLDEFGEMIGPPFPCFDQLLFDVPGSAEILHSPLLLIQVTRLRCGGFIFALRLNHTVCDGTGLLQFMNAIAEMARGADSPSIPPVWHRQLLSARTPPLITFQHREFDSLDDSKDVTFPLHHMTHARFFFRSSDISTIRSRHAQNHKCTTFEILTACIWRSSIISLNLDSSTEVRIVFPVNVRNEFRPPIPKGYYGNAYTLAMAIGTAGILCEKPFGYALSLVKEAKSNITEEYMKSLMDFLVVHGRPSHTSVGASYVSDGVNMGFEKVDFGWGEAVYGGRAKVWGGAKPRVASLFGPLMNYRGDNGIFVNVYLPIWAVERFSNELDSMVTDSSVTPSLISSRIIRTAL